MTGVQTCALPISIQGKDDSAFSINVVSVRNIVVKGRVRNKAHEEFIIRTRRKGNADVFVARRYGDFTRLAETVSSYVLVPCATS